MSTTDERNWKIGRGGCLEPSAAAAAPGPGPGLARKLDKVMNTDGR